MPRTPPHVTALTAAAANLREQCGALRFRAPVACTYHPLDYAWGAHRAYLGRAQHGVTALFVGMNPGPFGMVQTGIPFGEVSAVRQFLGIDASTARIVAPAHVHPKRPVEGFACTRSEVSGARVWGWARERFATSEAFFGSAFIWNWCPLAFVSATGANLTPDKLPRTGSDGATLRALEAACDQALVACVRAIAPSHVVGFGAFAAARARTALAALGASAPPISQALHPSPASPAANRGWAPQFEAQLLAAGVRFARLHAATAVTGGPRGT